MVNVEKELAEAELLLLELEKANEKLSISIKEETMLHATFASDTSEEDISELHRLV